MIGYVKHFESNGAMSFKVSDNKLLKKYKKIWEKISDKSFLIMMNLMINF